MKNKKNHLLNEKINYLTNQLINLKIRRLEKGSQESRLTLAQYEAKVSRIQADINKLKTPPTWADKD